jgi:hypothetical protein
MTEIQKIGPEKGRIITVVKLDDTVYEPESLKKARLIPAMTDEQARRAQRRDKGHPVR